MLAHFRSSEARSIELWRHESRSGFSGLQPTTRSIYRLGYPLN